MLNSILLATGLLAAGTLAASAHVTLEQGEAAAGSSYKAVLRVGHGCDGSPTTKITVKVPEGMIAAKPMPHAGWTVETTKGPYAKAHNLWGTPVSEGVVEITWTGGRLLDEHYDEFVFRGTIAADVPAGALFFPVVQECETGVHRWIEIPAAGQSEDALESPAPVLTVTPKR